MKVPLEPWPILARAIGAIPLPAFLIHDRIAHFYPHLSPFTGEFISEQLPQLLLHLCYWSRASDLLHSREHPGAVGLRMPHPRFCPAAEPFVVPWKGSKPPVLSHLWPKCPCTVIRDHPRALLWGHFLVTWSGSFPAHLSHRSLSNLLMTTKFAL